MTTRRKAVLLLVVGVLLADLLALVSGASRLPVAGIALVLCVVPLGFQSAVPVSAARAADRRQTVEQATRRFLWGAPLRMAWVFGGAGAIWYVLGDRLSVGFWVALLVCYLATLALHVLQFRAAAIAPGGGERVAVDR